MTYHLPVMPKEVDEFLVNDENGVYVDCTLGGGGHSEYLLEHHENIKIIGIDRDEDAIKTASEKLARFGDRVSIIKGNFKDISSLFGNQTGSVAEMPHRHPLAGTEAGTINFTFIQEVPQSMMKAFSGGAAGFLLDLGISSHQVDETGRGFSFKSQTLDMRMDRSGGTSAQEIVNTWTEEELAGIFFEYGEERMSRQIARAIVVERAKARVASALRLTDIVGSVKKAHGRINPATLVFQALRIAVNGELENLQSVLSSMPQALSKEGRIVTLSYHSLEDRMIKQSFKEKAQEGLLKILTKKVIFASPEEEKVNPRSRSAKLRCAERI